MMSNGISKPFLTIAAAFAEAERDRIRERIGRAKADQKSRGRFLGGDVPFGFLPREGRRGPFATRCGRKGFQISHVGVARILKGRRPA
jgi:DNA invertase Pin-like site-specific DNA recombinase